MRDVAGYRVETSAGETTFSLRSPARVPPRVVGLLLVAAFPAAAALAQRSDHRGAAFAGFFLAGVTLLVWFLIELDATLDRGRSVRRGLVVRREGGYRAAPVSITVDGAPLDFAPTRVRVLSTGASPSATFTSVYLAGARGVLQVVTTADRAAALELAEALRAELGDGVGAVDVGIAPPSSELVMLAHVAGLGLVLALGLAAIGLGDPRLAHAKGDPVYAAVIAGLAGAGMWLVSRLLAPLVRRAHEARSLRIARG